MDDQLKRGGRGVKGGGGWDVRVGKLWIAVGRFEGSEEEEEEGQDLQR